MGPKIGYLLPTRERVMAREPAAGPLLKLAEMAEGLGFDSVWAGDSLTARPRHEPLALLAGVAGRTTRVELGTAVLLPALRNPVLLAHQVATIDQLCEGRFILGVGIAGDAPAIRAEFTAAGVPFQGRVGRLLEGIRLCRALWSGEPVTWLGRWELHEAVLGPAPHRQGGPPVWVGGSAPAALVRAGRHFDGWLPLGPDAEGIAKGWLEVQRAADAAGRDPNSVVGAAYLTVSLDQHPQVAEDRLRSYLEAYYGAPADALLSRQAAYAGTPGELGPWLRTFEEAGASHLVLRIVGDHGKTLETVAAIRRQVWSG